MKKSYKNTLIYFLTLALLWQEIFFAYALSPDDINNQVFHLDAQNIDGNNDPSDDPINGTQVDSIIDNFNSHSGAQITGIKRPIFTQNSINSYPALKFDGSDDLLEVHDHIDIGSGTGYAQKSFSLVFRSGNNVNSPQTIYEQGGKEKGFLFHINAGSLYAGAYNMLDWPSGEEIKILNLGSINTNTNYILIMSFDSMGNTISAHLNRIAATSLTNISLQTTNGACPLDSTSFGCNLYLSGGSIGIGAVKNDTYNPQSGTGVSLFEGYFFDGFLGEIASWNTALNITQQEELTDYLMVKWGFDSTPPEITNTPFASGSLLPGGSHTLSYTYQDTGTGASGIDINSVSLEIFPWEGATWGSALGDTKVGTGSITASGASFITNNLESGRYLLKMSVSDERGNTQSDERVIYIDTPTFSLSDSELNLGNIQAGEVKNSNIINMNVTTLGAAFRIILEKQDSLKRLIGTEEIEAWNGSSGYGYRIDSGGIQNDSSSNTIINQAVASNFSDAPINYSYSIDLEALIDEQTAAGEYEGNYNFHIEFDY